MQFYSQVAEEVSMYMQVLPPLAMQYTWVVPCVCIYVHTAVGHTVQHTWVVLCTYVYMYVPLLDILYNTHVELEIVVCHLPFSEQNTSMADRNWVGSAIWLTNNWELWVSVIGYTYCITLQLSANLLCQPQSFVLKIPLCTYIRTSYIIYDGLKRLTNLQNVLPIYICNAGSAVCPGKGQMLFLSLHMGGSIQAVVLSLLSRMCS